MKQLARRIYGVRPTPNADPDFEYRWRMCFRKVHYETEEKAKKASKRFKKSMRAYLCPVHEPKHWHLTSRKDETA